MPHTQIVHHRPPSRWSRMREAVRSLSLSGLSLKDPALSRYFDYGGSRTDAGVSVTEASALGYSPVWQAVTLIAGDIGSLPLHLYKRLPNGGKERYTAHPLYSLLHDAPNAEMTAMVWRETVQAHAMTWGGGYCEIERDGAGRPVGIWPLLPSQVTPFREGGVLAYRVSSFEGRPDVILPARDVLHIPGLGFDGITGYGVIRQARQSLGLLAASEQFGATFFGNGSTFGGVLSSPKQLGEKGTRNLRESVQSLHQGPDRAHRFLILEEGMSYTRLGVPPNDAQFLETRRFSVEEVARWFNLPVSKLREMTNSSVRANIEQEALDYVVSSLRPWLVRWEQEMKRKLISPLERNTQHIEFAVEGLLRGDIASRYEAYAVGRQWGWLSANEIRALENLNPITDGDKYLSPMNMTPADRLDEVIDAQTREPKAAPAAPTAAAGDSGDTNRTITELLVKLETQATAIGELQVRAETLQLAVTAGTALRDKLASDLASERQANAQACDLWSSEAMAFRDVEGELRTSLDETKASLAAETLARQSAEAATGGAQTRAEAAEARLADLTTQVAYRDTSIEAIRAELAETHAALLVVSDAREATARELAEARTTAERKALGHAEAVAGKDAEIEALMANVAAGSDALAEAQHLRAEAEASATEARAEAGRAIVRAEDAEAAKETAEQAQTHAERAAQAATTARAEAEQARDAAVQTLGDRLTAVITANRAMAVDVMSRLAAHEADKARRQQRSPATLRAWASTFYPQFEQFFVDRMTPVMAAHLALIGSTADPMDAARALAQEHISDSKVQIDAVSELGHVEDMGGVLAQVTDRWERQRPEAVADRLMRAEIAHVRELR